MKQSSVISLGLFFCLVTLVRAQESMPNNLFQNLQDLKKNVDQMTLANQTMVLKNDKIKADLKQLQIVYQKLNQAVQESL